ncbi:MAG TPA: metal ABC transporter permease, partial [Acidimicrobiales bacterium]|nr:metal ABC transporter permease [Acidimicrobiales bacterium]
MFSGFMANAWAASTVVAALAGAVGFFVVLRGAAFAAHAVPNGAFAGAAGAALLGGSELLGLVTAAVLAALAIGWLAPRGRRDAITALTLTTLLALGAAFLSRTSEYSSQVFSLLFGDLLAVST